MSKRPQKPSGDHLRRGKPRLKPVVPPPENPTIVPPRRGLRLPDAACYVGVSSSKFQAMVGEKVMPQPFKAGGVTLWDLRKIDEAFDALSNQEDDSEWDDLHV
jgi:predicted DNA-binding transcriptional regulator AlpA